MNLMPSNNSYKIDFPLEFEFYPFIYTGHPNLKRGISRLAIAGLLITSHTLPF